MRPVLFTALVLGFLTHRAYAAGTGFDEPPQPDELHEPASPDRAPTMSLSAGPVLVLPGADASTFARASLGMRGWWARWLSPHVALVITAERVSLSTRPIVPATASVGWYAVGAGIRASSSRRRAIHIYAQTDVAQHAMQIANDGWTRSAVAARLRAALGLSVRLAHDLELGFAAGHDQVQTSLGSGRPLRVETTSFQLSIGWRGSR